MGIGQQGSTETTGQRPGDSTSVTTGHPVYSIRQPWGSERGAPWPSGPCSGGGGCLWPLPLHVAQHPRSPQHPLACQLHLWLTTGGAVHLPGPQDPS